MQKSQILLSVSFLFLSMNLAAQSIAPGVWEAKSSFKLNGVPLPGGEDQECVTAADAKDAKITITKELKKRGCVVTKWDIKGKNLDAALKCENDDMNAIGRIKGTFSDKSYKLSGDAEGTYKNVLPAEATLALEGRWLKKCE